MKWYYWTIVIVIVVIGIFFLNRYLTDKKKLACFSSECWKNCMAVSNQPSGDAAATECITKCKCEFPSYAK